MPNRFTWHLAGVLASTVLASAAGACATAQARPEVAQPLRIPDPPPRAAIDPVDVPTLASDSVGGRQGRPTPVAAVPPAPPPTAPPAATSAAPSVAPPAAAGPPVLVPPPTAPATPPPAELRPGGSGSTRVAVRDVTEMIERTSRKLEALDRRRLSAGKQADYDATRSFLTQAQAAVKANNLTLAQSAAEKAERLADGLR